MAQIYRTIPFANVQPVLYQLSIRSPGASFAEFATYTFPLSPNQLRVTRNSMSSFTDVQGPPSSQGVTRVMDTFGLAPPIFEIRGTTGWDRHLSDGYILSGLQSMQLLQQFLATYATLNQTQRQNGISQLYTLEFYDYFGSNFWVVEPVGPQSVSQASDRPVLSYYNFRWAGVKPAGLPLLGAADAIAQVFGTPAQVAALNAASTTGAIIAAYSPTGPLSIGSFTL